MEQAPSFYVAGRLVQPTLNRIAGAGAAVQVEPKMMQVLLCLALRPGEVWSRGDLLAAVWPDVVVGEEVVSRSISELRKVFEDDARAPRVIETIPRVGYRLIAPVSDREEGAGRVPASARAPGAGPDAGRRTRGGKRWLVVAGVLAAGVALAGFLVLRRQPPLVTTFLRTVPVTSYPGQEFDPALSPDGHQVAFIWTGPDNGDIDLYVKAVGTETPLRLTQTMFYEFSPAFSPDGQQIAFARSMQGLFTVPTLGGPERKLADIGAASEPDLDWAPQGNRIAFSDRDSSDGPYGLYVLDLERGTRRALTAPSAYYYGDRSPAFSPDGRRLAFVRITDQASDLYVVSLDGGAPRRLTTDHVRIAGLTWTADGRGVVFSSNRGGTFGLWRIPASGGSPEPLGLVGSDVKNPALARDGSRLVFVRSMHATSILRQALEGDTAPAAAPLLASTQWDSNPRYSPDGRRIAFASTRSGSAEIWVCEADGSAPVRLTAFGGPHAGVPRWSPDGKYLAFEARTEGQPDVFVLSVEGGSPRRITSSPALDVAPSWSHDGRWVYFGSNRSGRWQVWKVPAGGGEAVQVTRDGGRMALEGPGGTALYFTRSDSAGIWRMPVGGGAPVKVVQTLGRSYAAAWDVTPRGLYHVNSSAKPSRLDFLDFGTGQITAVAPYGHPEIGGDPGFTVSPDGRALLFNRREYVGHDIMVADGSFE